MTRIFAIGILVAMGAMAMLWVFAPQSMPWLRNIRQGLGEPGIGARRLQPGIFGVLVFYVAGRLVKIRPI